MLPSFAAQIARIEAGLAEPRLRVGNLAVERDFLHVADVADAYVRLLERAGGFRGFRSSTSHPGKPTRSKTCF